MEPERDFDRGGIEIRFVVSAAGGQWGGGLCHDGPMVGKIVPQGESQKWVTVSPAEPSGLTRRPGPIF